MCYSLYPPSSLSKEGASFAGTGWWGVQWGQGCWHHSLYNRASHSPLYRTPARAELLWSPSTHEGQTCVHPATGEKRGTCESFTSGYYVLYSGLYGRTCFCTIRAVGLWIALQFLASASSFFISCCSSRTMNIPFPWQRKFTKVSDLVLHVMFFPTWFAPVGLHIHNSPSVCTKWEN